jgi:methyl-accepting chemotaxis protein
MFIANPIYDVFFKYLLEDTELAKRLISAIIGEEIIELSVEPQEATIAIPQYFLSVIRLDFKATILTEQGTDKKVLIELQKGKVAFDITRFRKYLGENYSKNEAVQGKQKKQPLPIIAIYFLGFEIDELKIPVIKASHQYYDVINNQPIHTKNDFIEQLIHDCFVIQIPHLSTKMKTRLEKILAIFNQAFVVTDDLRRLAIPDEWLNDPEVRAFIDRLSRPLFDENLQRQADAEDNLLETLEDMERQIEQSKTLIENQQKAISEQEKAISEQQKTISEKEKALDEQAKMIAELQKQLSESKKTK